MKEPTLSLMLGATDWITSMTGSDNSATHGSKLDAAAYSGEST